MIRAHEGKLNILAPKVIETTMQVMGTTMQVIETIA